MPCRQATATVTGTDLHDFCGDDRLQADEQTGRATDVTA
jgi:hypothetical protein